MIIFCLMAGMLHAQDTIYRVDGSKQLGKIIDINPTQVNYIRADNPEGPVFRITKNTVAKIVYEDGSAISFQEIREPDVIGFSETKRETAYRNIVAFNSLHPFFLNTVSVSYERLSKSGKLGYKIPLSIGISEMKRSYTFHKSFKEFKTGLALNFSPFDDPQHRYYLGISGTIAGKNYISYRPEIEKNMKFFLAFSIYNGYHYNLTSRFLLNLQLGIGYDILLDRFDSELAYLNKKSSRLIFPFEFSICYTF